MLAYVYCDLNKKQYACLAVENFEDIEDLLTSILIKGVNYQLKKGLYTDYQEKEDLLLVVRGKIVLQKTLNQLNTDVLVWTNLVAGDINLDSSL